MSLRSLINKTIILSFFMFAGFLLAKSLYYGNMLGVFLAAIGIIAWTMLLYKLNSILEKKPESETEELEKNY